MGDTCVKLVRQLEEFLGPFFAERIRNGVKFGGLLYRRFPIKCDRF